MWFLLAVALTWPFPETPVTRCAVWLDYHFCFESRSPHELDHMGNPLLEDERRT
jgi:hypothetical protein